MAAPDLAAAADAVALAHSLVIGAARHLGAGRPQSLDAHQVVAYDLAHSAAATATAGSAIDYGQHGRVEASLATVFAADAVWDLATRLIGREHLWGAEPNALAGAAEFVRSHRDPEWLAGLAGQAGPRHLEPDFELVGDSFRRFADQKITPLAQRIHRDDADIPEEIIEGLARLGAFGLSIPEAYGGFATGGEHEFVGMVVATEELSRGSLGAGGSLITRPEILARALLRGGTEAQKRTWLPGLATGEIMAAVAVSEPDHGSDVAGITASAHRTGDEWVINGTKTWCTFAARADVLMVLARTDPDRSQGHRGLSILLVPKERAEGRGFVLTQPGGGRLDGHPIDTIGYRGMHSYELSFDDWRVPADHVVGGEAGVGRGFYLQMEGFANGRLQTAARAVGVMQASYEAAVTYASERHVFGQSVSSYQLTQVKLTRMAAIIQASRQHMYAVARLMSDRDAGLEASMVKSYTCRAAEWVTREAMQLHGGMGYAEESAVSRLFVDARVLSIFEGADEILALRVIARRLVEAAGSEPGNRPRDVSSSG
jgi:(2S)-methylsuccinyl-CoA dehydrogenase